MEYRARLVHAEAKSRVVLVGAYAGERCLGSALGEATTAEEAEDRARERLRQRLTPGGSAGALEPSPPAVEAGARSVPSDDRSSPQRDPAGPRRPASASAPSSAPEQPREAPQPHEPQPPPEFDAEPAPSAADPEDWSADLIHLDAHLASLGWGREQERVYLRRLFGQPSRSRLTRYADLMVLRRALESVPPGSAPETAPLPILRRDLLSQCDELLGQLSWTTERARQWLETHFAVSSRQRLSDDQLLAFNLLLEAELMGETEIGDASRCLESPAASTESSLS
jgi:hypothetical protein